jgi:hypothetical protein
MATAPLARDNRPAQLSGSLCDRESMRLSVHLTFVAALLVASASSARAQLIRGIGRRAADAVERKAEQKIDRKIDEKIEQAADRIVNRSFDAIFGPESTGQESKSSGGGGSAAGARLFSLMPNAPTEAHYDFDVVLSYEVVDSPKSRKAEPDGLMMMHFNSGGQFGGARFTSTDASKKNNEAFIIFDGKNESMVMLFAADEGKFSVAYGWKDAARYVDTNAGKTPSAGTATPAEAEADAIRFSKLGTKTIAGYKADGYRSEDEKTIVDMWVSTDASIAYSRMMAASSTMKQMRGTVPSTQPVGMLLETVFTDRQSGDKGRMTAIKIEKNAKVRVDMQEYPRAGKMDA